MVFDDYNTVYVSEIVDIHKYSMKKHHLKQYLDL